MDKIKFTPLPHQVGVLDYFMNGGKRAVMVWHRRAGKDLTMFNWTWVASQQRVGIYYYFYPTYAQAKKAIWYGMDEDGTKFLDYIPVELIERTHDTDMRIHMANGSLIQLIGSDNIDSIMSTNPIGCVFSEYAIQDPRGWRFVSPILRKNGGWAAFPYTPRGHNHGYDLYMGNKDQPSWYTELLTIEDTGLIDPSSLDDDRRSGIPEEIIQQEYYCSFSASTEGSYFGNEMAKALSGGRIRPLVHHPGLLVHTSWDFGVNDNTVVWFIQVDGNTVWAFDLYQSNNAGIDHYAQVLRSKGYVYGSHLAPHDVTHRSFVTGGSIMDAAYKLGIDFTEVPKTPKLEQIKAAHMLIPRTVFCSVHCEDGVSGLMAYERDWDQKAKTHKNTPRHNWASHIADAYMCLAVGFDRIAGNNDRPTHSQGYFDPMHYESYSGDYDPRNVKTPEYRDDDMFVTGGFGR